MTNFAMKNRGFTLIELVIVLALISISALIGLRFISNMAYSQVANAERSQALSGARFAIERLRRELSEAYSPSVYVDNTEAGAPEHCIYFVPVAGAGTYSGQAKDSTATFFWPTRLSAVIPTDINMAINAPSVTASSSDAWRHYPAGTLPDNVASLSSALPAADSFIFADLFSTQTASPFVFDSAKQRYTLLKQQQLRFCLNSDTLIREVRSGSDWQEKSVMLTGLTNAKVFGSYNQSSQLITVDFTLKTRDGDLVLSSQLQVGYEP